jgi:hypothetical protein
MPFLEEKMGVNTIKIVLTDTKCHPRPHNLVFMAVSRHKINVKTAINARLYSGRVLLSCRVLDFNLAPEFSGIRHQNHSFET